MGCTFTSIFPRCSGRVGTDHRGSPWTLHENRHSIYDYSRGACPQSDDLFSRTQLLTIPSCLCVQDEEDILAAFRDTLDTRCLLLQDVQRGLRLAPANGISVRRRRSTIRFIPIVPRSFADAEPFLRRAVASVTRMAARFRLPVSALFSSEAPERGVPLLRSVG